MTKAKDLSKITLILDGEEKEFKRGFVDGRLLLLALQFKAKFERITRDAGKRLREKNPDITNEEIDSEVTNILLVDNDYIGESAQIISQSFGGQFTAEEFIKGTSAGELIEKSQEYVASAINGIAGDVGEETENFPEGEEK